MIGLIVGIVCITLAALMLIIISLFDKIEELEKKIKTLSQDLNMVSKTMENNMANKKQILKG